MLASRHHYQYYDYFNDDYYHNHCCCCCCCCGSLAYACVPLLAHGAAASWAPPDNLRRVLALIFVPEALPALGVLFGVHAFLLLTLLLLFLALLLALLAPRLAAAAAMHLDPAAHFLCRNLPHGRACTASWPNRTPVTTSDRGCLHLALILSHILSAPHRLHATPPTAHLDHLHLGLLGLAFGRLEGHDFDLLKVDVRHGSQEGPGACEPASNLDASCPIGQLCRSLSKFRPQGIPHQRRVKAKNIRCLDTTSPVCVTSRTAGTPCPSDTRATWSDWCFAAARVPQHPR